MVRAATAGMIDFSLFDPWDAWWWKKLRWTIAELESSQTREVTLAQHTHWVTLASHSRLKDESFDQAQTNATTAFNKLLKLTYPWMAKQIGEDGTKTSRDAAIEEYHRIFGRPGEERYEEMIDNLSRVMVKMTKSQKERARKMRKLKNARREFAGAI